MTYTVGFQAPSLTVAAAIYVPAGSKLNLEIGIKNSLWGWRAETAEKAGTKTVLADLKPFDYVLLGHKGPSPRVKPGGWAARELRSLYVARVSGGLFQSTKQVWPDDVYPYRVRLEILDLMENVSGLLLGPEVMEAFRLSANKQGSPVPPANASAANPNLLGDDGSETYDGPDPEDGYLNVTGELDKATQTLVRREQKRLRRKKFGLAARIRCALCGEVLPARVVHTAHIKRRKDCDFTERRTLANIMGACVLGCDSLFEHGDLYVDGNGIVQASPRTLEDPGLSAHASARVGTPCPEFNADSSPFFAWHRQNVAFPFGQ